MSPTPPVAVWMRIFSPFFNCALRKAAIIVIDTTGNEQASSKDNEEGLGKTFAALHVSKLACPAKCSPPL
ncbi:hypothetical protein C2W64_04750 [Brevibacillus laterosporus]|nr:hypothetical protein C2W64_04750 [Brevibacillus laterosporus]